MPYARPYNKRKRRPFNEPRQVVHRAADSDEEDYDNAPIQSSIERINAINDNAEMEDEDPAVAAYRPIQGPQNRTMAQRGLRSKHQSAILGRGYNDIYGGETRITEVPGPYPTWLPETQTMTHKIYTRSVRKQDVTASGSGYFTDNQSFDWVISPLDPGGFLTSIAGDTATGDLTWSDDRISMWHYMEQHYMYYTVLACRVTFEITDWGCLSASPFDHSYSQLAYIGMWPDCTLFEIAYSSNEPKTESQVALADSEFKKLVTLRNVKVHDFKDKAIHPHQDEVAQRKQVLILKQTYTKQDYNKIMDITTDAENTIWTATGGTPTLPFYVEFMPRWHEFRTCEASGTIANYFTVYMHVEWDVQWKQLSTELSGGYWNTPDLHV